MGVRLAGGILAGAIAGAALGLLIMLGYSPIDVQSVFIRLSPDLLEFLAFGQPAPVGAVMQIGLNALIGLLGAGLLLLPSRLRGPIIAGLLGVALASMVEPYLRPRLQQVSLDDLVNLLYRQHGLTIAAAIVIFVGVAAIAVIWGPTRHRINRRMASLQPEQRRTVRFSTFVVIALFVLLLPLITGQFISQVLVLVGLYLLLALGLNIVVGYAGLLDLGYVAFFAVGAYLMAILTSPDGPLNAPLVQLAGESGAFWLALPFVMMGAAFTGLLIGAPVLRLRGDYLAIVTLGFGEIARILFLSDALSPWLGGVQGIIGIPSPLPGRMELAFGPFDFVWRGPMVIFYVILLFCVFAAFVAWRLAGSRVGRRLGRHARGRGGCRDHRREHRELQAAGVRHGGRPWLFVRRAVCRAAGLRLPWQLQHPGLDHGAGHHHPGRHGQHPRRDRRCPRADRLARAVARVRRVPPACVRGGAGGDDAAATGGPDPEHRTPPRAA